MHENISICIYDVLTLLVRRLVSYDQYVNHVWT